MATAPHVHEEPAPEEAPQPSGERGWPAALVLVAALAAGAGLAAAAMPWLLRHVSTDLSRIGVVLDALRDPALSPHIVVLGNSVVMYGVDARQLSAELTRPLPAVNLASTGQSLAESLLLVQELPFSVRRVVLVVGHADLTLESGLDPQKYNAFYMFGFRPSGRTEAALVTAFGDPARALLGQSDLEQRFRARWIVRQFFDMGLRRRLRPELALEHSTRDLFFPHAGATRLPEEKIERLLKASVAGAAHPPKPISPAKDALLSAIVREMKRRRISLTLFLPPVHPVILAAEELQIGGVRDELARRTSQDGTRFADLSSLLGPEDFLDHLHPTLEGARRFTSAVAAFLARSH